MHHSCVTISSADQFSGVHFNPEEEISLLRLMIKMIKIFKIIKIIKKKTKIIKAIKAITIKTSKIYNKPIKIK